MATPRKAPAPIIPPATTLDNCLAVVDFCKENKMSLGQLKGVISDIEILTEKSKDLHRE